MTPAAPPTATGLLLAAGAGRRFGGPKALATPLTRHPHDLTYGTAGITDARVQDSARTTSRACCRSSGSSERNVTQSPVPGWVNDSCAACSH